MAAPTFTPRPTTAFTLGLIGGIFVLLGGVLFLITGIFGIFGLLGIPFGIVVIIASVMMYRQPANHVPWSILVLVFSLVSILSLGGFLAGLIVGTIGGGLGIAWKPYSSTPSVPYAYGGGPFGVPVMPWRMCMGCGRWIPWVYNVCPLCGTQAPIPAWSTTPAPQSQAGTLPQAAPPPAPVAPSPAPTTKAPCPTCEAEAEFLPAQNRWFCRAEARYF